MKISIITPAYRCKNFVKDYIESIREQSFFKFGFVDYEILFVTDNCRETLSEIIKYKDKDIRIFENKGKNVYPYVLRNTLLKKAKGDYILFFDADDIMMPNLIARIITNLKDSHVTRFRYYNFKDSINNKTTIGIKENCQFAHGVFFASKEIMKKSGGFLSWVCGSDSEFLQRLKYNGIKENLINEFLFYRRIHSESLTRNETTGLRSELRNKYKKIYHSREICELNIKTKTIKVYEIK